MKVIGNETAEGFGQPIRDNLPHFLISEAQTVDRVLGGETVMWQDTGYAVMRQGRRTDAWFNATFSPVRDAGAVVGAILVAFEVTDYLMAQRRLAAELQHRVRNSLSVIRSIARRTAENSETLEEFADHLDGRLGAFARTQGAIVSYGADGLELHSVIVDELAAAAAREGDQFTLSGPDLRLQSMAAEALGLAFHELATNAIKYGALAVDGGSIAVSWRIDEEDDTRLVILWEETCPKIALPLPTHRGFGTELLERMLDHEIEAVTSLDYGSTGLTCTISLSLTTNVVAEPDPSR